MLYQPNFCCQCGQKIERIDWKLWTSRRFCEDCEVEFRKEEWFFRLTAAFCVLVGIAGFGSYLKTPEKPLNLLANQPVISSSNKVQNSKALPNVTNGNLQSALSNQNSLVNTVSQNKPEEQIKQTTHI